MLSPDLRDLRPDLRAQISGGDSSFARSPLYGDCSDARKATASAAALAAADGNGGLVPGTAKAKAGGNCGPNTGAKANAQADVSGGKPIALADSHANGGAKANAAVDGNAKAQAVYKKEQVAPVDAQAAADGIARVKGSAIAKRLRRTLRRLLVPLRRSPAQTVCLARP